MLEQAGVKSIVFGGRPSKSPVAAIGGTQGAQVLDLLTISAYAAVAMGSIKQPSSQAQQVLAPLTQNPPMLLNLNINFADSFFGGESTTTPLQFQKARSADCRVFYTKEDLTSVRATWERLAMGEYTCVDGGTKW